MKNCVSDAVFHASCMSQRLMSVSMLFCCLQPGYRRENIGVLKIEPYDNAFSKQLHSLWNSCWLTHIDTVNQHRFFNQVNKIRSKMKEILDFRTLTWILHFPQEILLKFKWVYYLSITNVRVFHIICAFIKISIFWIIFRNFYSILMVLILMQKIAYF
jgi:hypothetical protein